MDTIPAPLKGKVAIVTGGSRGIGASIVQKFAHQGCSHIAITYNTNKGKAEEVLAAAREISPKIKTCAIAGNVIDPEFGKNVVEQSLEKLETDHIDVVVSNAAHVDANQFAPVDSMTKKDWDELLTGDAWAPLCLAREAIKFMPPGGRIIMLSSGSSKIAQGDPTIAYAAAKAAMDAVSRNLAAAWATKYGVTVNSISVGATDTESMKEAGRLWGAEFLKMAENFSMFKRLGRAEEVADIVAFVASPAASWITGNQIPANGGALSMLQS